MGEEVFDPRDARGHLDHVVERAELEDQVLEPLRRGAKLDEHFPERLRDLADLVDLTEPRHRGGRRALGRRRRGLLLCGRRRRERLTERATEVRHARGEAPEENVAEQRDRKREKDTDLRFGRLEELKPPHEIHEDQQRQDGGQREDRACGFAELHRTLTDSRSLQGVARRQDVPSLFPSVPGAGARDKAEKGPRHSAELRQNILKDWNTCEGVSFARALLATTTEWSRERRAHNR